MSTQCSVRLSLAGAIALALSGLAMTATAQTPSQQAARQVPPASTTASMPAQPPPVPPRQPMPQQPQQQPMNNQQSAGGSMQFAQGTESSVSFPMQNGNGTVTVHSGMPAHVKSYGPPPPFATLDADHNGRISESEAQAYPPLDSDFLYASGGGKSISHSRYTNWVNTQH